MTEQAVCPHCGAARASWALFCGRCGQEFDAASEASVRPSPVLASPAPSWAKSAPGNRTPGPPAASSLHDFPEPGPVSQLVPPRRAAAWASPIVGVSVLALVAGAVILGVVIGVMGLQGYAQLAGWVGVFAVWLLMRTLRR